MTGKAFTGWCRFYESYKDTAIVTSLGRQNRMLQNQIVPSQGTQLKKTTKDEIVATLWRQFRKKSQKELVVERKQGLVENITGI